jgi:hypothetical protein
LTLEAAHKVAVMLLQRSTVLGTDFINLILNQHHELVMKGKMDVDKAWELTANLHLLGGSLQGPNPHCPSLFAHHCKGQQQGHCKGPLLYASSSPHYAGIQVKGNHSPSKHGDGTYASPGLSGCLLGVHVQIA